jgi:hypothetical protein
MSEYPIQDKQDMFQMIWAKRLFVLSLVLLGIVFSLQGVRILEFPVTSTTSQQKQIKPVRVGGLLCHEPIWDFGSVDSIKNSKLAHEFILVNESKETVTIQKIHSTCGCMVAEDFDKELLPGKSTKIKVNVQLPSIPQLFHKNLAVQIEKGVIPLDVVGEIVINDTLYSLPKKIDFGIITPEDTKERIVQVFRYDLSDIVCDNVSMTIAGITCKCEIVDDVNCYKLTLRTQITTTAKYPYPSNIIDGEMVIKTKNPHSELKIPVCVRVARFSDGK